MRALHAVLLFFEFLLRGKIFVFTVQVVCRVPFFRHNSFLARAVLALDFAFYLSCSRFSPLNVVPVANRSAISLDITEDADCGAPNPLLEQAYSRAVLDSLFPLSALDRLRDSLYAPLLTSGQDIEKDSFVSFPARRLRRIFLSGPFLFFPFRDSRSFVG